MTQVKDFEFRIIMKQNGEFSVFEFNQSTHLSCGFFKLIRMYDFILMKMTKQKRKRWGIPMRTKGLQKRGPLGQDMCKVIIKYVLCSFTIVLSISLLWLICFTSNSNEIYNFPYGKEFHEFSVSTFRFVYDQVIVKNSHLYFSLR